MRHFCLVLVGLLATAACTHGQQQSQPTELPALNPQNPLDALLMQWEAKMKSVQTLYAEVVRTKDDKQFKVRQTYVGKAKYMKPNLALLDLQNKDRPAIFERFICTGTFLFEYNQQAKQIRVHELPPPKPGQIADDNFLSFIFGMQAAEAKRRYDISLYKEDANYQYLKILPRFPADSADFKTAFLALTKTNLLPRMLIFDEPNNNRVTWDIPVIDTGVRLDRQEFTQPQPPPGWTLFRVPKAQEPQGSNGNLPPRLVRPTKP